MALKMRFTKYARTMAISISCAGKHRRLMGHGIWFRSGNCHERAESGNRLSRLVRAEAGVCSDHAAGAACRPSACLMDAAISSSWSNLFATASIVLMTIRTVWRSDSSLSASSLLPACLLYTSDAADEEDSVD